MTAKLFRSAVRTTVFCFATLLTAALSACVEAERPALVEASAATEVPNTAAGGVIDPEDELDAIVAFLRGTLESESEDRLWMESLQPQVTRDLESLAVSVDAMECGSTFCRLDVHGDDLVRKLGSEIVDLETFAVAFFYRVSRSDPSHADLFIARDGHSLPDWSAALQSLNTEGAPQ